MTLLGAYVVPHDRPVWSRGVVTLPGEFGFSISAAAPAGPAQRHFDEVTTAP